EAILRGRQFDVTDWHSSIHRGGAESAEVGFTKKKKTPRPLRLRGALEAFTRPRRAVPGGGRKAGSKSGRVGPPAAPDRPARSAWSHAPGSRTPARAGDRRCLRTRSAPPPARWNRSRARGGSARTHPRWAGR